MDEKIISNPEENPFSIEVKNFDTDKTKWEIQKGVVNPPKDLPLPNELGELKFILEDILAGDSSQFDNEIIKNLNIDNIMAAIEWLARKDNLSETFKDNLLADGWRLNFKAKPPTPAEFLTEKYIGNQAESTYDWARDVFIDFMDPLKPYRTLVLAQHIGSGKSTLSTLIQLFISTHYAMMWHPWKYFNLAPSSVFTQCLGAWNQKKASELLLEPFVQILEQSPYFKRVRTHTDLVDAAGEDLAEHICWTTSTPTSVLSMQNGVNYKIINGPGSILGQNIISAVVSEMTMFTENGWTNDQVFKFFTKLRKRIDNRMKGNYYGRMIIDSQPNTLESVIDDWIWNEAPKSSENYIVTGSRWKFFPQEFPYAWKQERKNWKSMADESISSTKDAIKKALDQDCLKKDFNKKQTFPIFKGTNGQPPKVVESESELTMYEPRDIIWAPTTQVTSNGNKSMLDAALESPIEFLRDQCGIPSGTPDRIFYNKQTVEDCFENNLRNMFGHITAPAEEEPEHLIWNPIKDKFFNKIIDKYYFYYEPGIPRVVSVDQSYAGDVTSIAMTHVERDSERKDDVTGEPVKVFVTDFIITIIPKGGIINLDAIKCFIWDLVSLGNIKIKHVSYDGFHSQPSIQFLKRKGIEVDYLSVDKTNEPYLNFIDYVQHKRWFAGKCIYMKNNMLSLHFEKRKQGKGTTKVDHFNGEIYTDGNGDWNTDMRGTNAKDAADAVTGTIELINRYENEFVPYVVWKPLALNDRSYETMKNKQDEFMEKMGFEL